MEYLRRTRRRGGAAVQHEEPGVEPEVDVEVEVEVEGHSNPRRTYVSAMGIARIAKCLEDPEETRE